MPLILVNGQIASRGAYLVREQIAALTGVVGGGDKPGGNFAQISRRSFSIPVLQAQSCCEPGDGGGESSRC